MKSNTIGGKIFFFKTDKSPNSKDCFSPLLEVNSNFNNLKSLNLTYGKAYGITINDELLEWEFEKKKTNKNTQNDTNQENPESSQNYIQPQIPSKKNDFYFLLTKPSYRFHKMKIKSISLNKTMCISLDTNGNVLVWGQSKDGLLGLGYDVNSVENPTILDGLVDIVDISLSDYHAVALNSSGTPFSWGLGKYGELGLERSIYSPVPQQMNTENLYSRVFCGNLITCFLDFEGHFSFFGVIIKQLGGNSSTVTTKNLLNDQNIDSKSIFLEKEFEELEDQKFKEIVIGNGFIGLLGNTGTLFTLEYNDKLTMLYSKYYLYNIVVAKNEIFGLAKDNVKIQENKNNSNLNKNNNLLNSTGDEKIKTNYYLCRWSSKSSSENEVCSDIWITTVWKFKDEFTNIIENGKLLDTNDKRNILLLLDSDEKYSSNLNVSVLNPNKKFLDLSTTNNELSMLDMSMNNNSTITENIMNFNLNKKKIPEKILDYEADFDDSYNLKYKRTKARSRSILKDLPYIGTIRSRSVSKILNKSYNGSFQNSAINLNKSNFVNFGNNNISAIGPNTSTFMNKKSLLIPTSNNYKRTGGKVFTNKFNNYNNLSNQNKNSKNKNNLNQNSKSSLSLNNNDLIEDNNDIDNNFNNFSPSDYNNMNSNNKNNQKENDNVNIYDQSIDVKERELNKYRTEIDDIIANYKNKQNIKKANLLNKYGLSRENNINITNKDRKENDMNSINNQNLSRENIIDINIKDQIENSNNRDNFDNINIENESPFKMDLNKRYEEENELNENIKNIKINDNNKNKNEKNTHLFDRIVQSSDKKIKNKNEIMKNVQHYFDINKVNSQKRNKRRKRNKSENEIEFDMNREETFQNVNNNDKFRRNNSFEINNQLYLFITSSEISQLIPTNCLSEGNDILNDGNDDIYNNNKQKDKNKYKNNIDIRRNKKDININNKNGNVEYNNNELISSPAFYRGNLQKNRLSDLIINETNKNKDSKEKNLGINLKGNNKNQEIKNVKKNNFDNLANKNIIYSNKNSRFSFGNSPMLKNNSELKDDKANLNENIFVIQNINNINLNCDKKQNKNKEGTNIESTKKNRKNIKENNIRINNENNTEKDNNSNFKEIKNMKQNKNKITKNNTKQNINNNVIYQSKNNTKTNDKNTNKKIPSNSNNQKNTNKNEENNKKGKIKIVNPEDVFSNKNNKLNQEKPYSKTSQENNYHNQKNNNEKKDKKDFYESDEDVNKKRYINLEDIEKKNSKNYQKQNVDEYNIDNFNDNMNNKYGDREPNLNNCDYSENDINENQTGNNLNNKPNNKKIFEKENIYSYKIGEKKNKNQINIESNQNNVNYQMNDSINENNNRTSNVAINKSSVTYFVYLIQNYMRKKNYLLCAYEIANFQRKYEKNLSLKLLFMVIKKRIIFYKIKFFHRYKKIYKYLVKFKKDYKIISGDSNQRTKNYNNYNIQGNKK